MYNTEFAIVDDAIVI